MRLGVCVGVCVGLGHGIMDGMSRNALVSKPLHLALVQQAVAKSV